MEKDVEKFKIAKTLLGYNISVSKSRKEDGSIDEDKLNELLKKNYEYIRSKFLKRKEMQPEMAERTDKDIKEVDYLYSLIKDGNARRENDELAKENAYAEKLPIKPEDANVGIIRSINSKYAKEMVYSFEVAPEGENKKHVIVIPKRYFEYTTKVGVIAYINEYIIVKNINGIEMHFDVTTNTRFDELDEIMNYGKPLTALESEYVRLFNNQMSDIHLRTCARKYKGYIGTVENNLRTAKFEMNEEDLSATTAIEREEERDK